VEAEAISSGRILLPGTTLSPDEGESETVLSLRGREDYVPTKIVGRSSSPSRQLSVILPKGKELHGVSPEGLTLESFLLLHTMVGWKEGMFRGWTGMAGGAK